VRQLLFPGRRDASALALALAVGTALPLLAPQLTKRFVDDAVAGEPLSTLLILAGLYLAVAVAAQAATVVTAWLASRVAWDGTNRIRERLADHAVRLDMAFHGRHTPGEMIERVDGDVVALSEFIVAFLLDVVASGLLLVGAVVLVSVEDLRIGAAIIVYVVVATLVLSRVQRRAIPAVTGFREAMAQLFGSLEERLAAAEDIRANGAGHHVVNRFHESAAAVYRADQRAEIRLGGMLAATNVATTLGTALVLGVGIALRGQGAISLGAVLLLFQYTQMVRRPLERMIDQLKEFEHALAGVTRIRELLAVEPALAPPATPVELPPSGPLAIELDDVTFAYADDGEEVLHHISLRVEPGRSLGIVGRTGSGKTTIGRLLLRLFDPTEGTVRVGGVDLREADPSQLRRRVAVVTQDVQLFASSVRDNVTLFRGDDVADDARITAALADLGLGSWLARLPDGLDTELGPGGAGLSAGEAQLLAFTRVFLTDPAVVVLDEASSRLDPATEHVIERAIDRLLRGRTAVLVAHRLSSLDRVDDIAVLDAGRLVEVGPREQLAADPASRFARLIAAAGAIR
jgi:ABC-type multidrug transport system fused ATPase/permease subunit